ncbi:MAG: hypothetical protein SNJ77_05475 [Cytophagales bacterium]
MANKLIEKARLEFSLFSRNKNGMKRRGKKTTALKSGIQQLFNESANVNKMEGEAIL